MKNDTKVLNSRLEALQEIRSRWVIVENRDESLSHILQLLREAGTLEYTGSEWVIVENDDEHEKAFSDQFIDQHIALAQLAAEGGDGADEELTLEEMWDWCVNYEEEPNA